jgi:hypothetical protein
VSAYRLRSRSETFGSLPHPLVRCLILWFAASSSEHLTDRPIKGESETDAQIESKLKDWRKANIDKLKESERASGTIKKSISDQILSSLPRNLPALELFQAIVDKFETKTSKVQTHYLRSDLYQSVYRDGDNLPEFLERVKTIINRLISFGHEIGDDDHANVLLTALRSTSYEQQIVTLIQTEQFDPNKIQSALENEWTRRQHDGIAATASKNAVLYGKNSNDCSRRPPFNQSRNSQQKPLSHRKPPSNNSPPRNNRSQSSGTNNNCHICGDPRHWARDCPQKP